MPILQHNFFLHVVLKSPRKRNYDGQIHPIIVMQWRMCHNDVQNKKVTWKLCKLITDM